MEQKERLINLIIESVGGCARNWAEVIADYLIKNGIIVPPCKVGDTVYAVTLNTERFTYGIHRGYVGCIDIREGGEYLIIRHEGLDDEPLFDKIIARFEDFGKTFFLTREEAEKALAERSKE